MNFKQMFIMLIPLQIVLVLLVKVKCLMTTTTNTTDLNITISASPTTTTTTPDQEWKPLSIISGEMRQVDSTTTTPINYNMTTIDPHLDTQLAQLQASPEHLPKVTTTPMTNVDNDDDDQLDEQDITSTSLKKKRKKKQKEKIKVDEKEIDDCCKRRLRSQKLKYEMIEEDEEQDEEDDATEDDDFDEHDNAPIMLFLRSNSRAISSKISRKRIKKNLMSQSSSSSNLSYGRHKKTKKRAKKSKKSKNKNKKVELSKPVMLIAETVQNEQEDENSGEAHKQQLKPLNLTSEQLEKLAEYLAQKNKPKSTTSIKTRDLSSSSAQYDLEPEVEYVQVSKGQLSSDIIPTPPPMPAMPVMANIYWRKVIYPPEPTLIQPKVKPITKTIVTEVPSKSNQQPEPTPDPHRPLINTRQPETASSPSSGEPKTANTKSVKKYTIYYIEKNDGKSKADQDDEEDAEDEEETEESDSNSSNLSRPATIDKIIKQIIEQNNDKKKGKTKYRIHKVTDSKVVFPKQLTRSVTSGRSKRIRLVPMTDEPRRHHRYIYG